jgi:hypothetical protein
MGRGGGEGGRVEQLHRIRTRKMAAGFFTDINSKPRGNQAPSFLELPKSRKTP